MFQYMEKIMSFIIDILAIHLCIFSNKKITKYQKLIILIFIYMCYLLSQILNGGGL
jgi:cytochrome bd-type quinol oxidase subunit 1